MVYYAKRIPADESMALIDSLGGSNVIAAVIKVSCSRVQEWRHIGIPVYRADQIKRAAEIGKIPSKPAFDRGDGQGRYGKVAKARAAAEKAAKAAAESQDDLPSALPIQSLRP